MKIELTEREAKIVYNKLNHYLIEQDHLKDMGLHTNGDDDEVWAIMKKLIKEGVLL